MALKLVKMDLSYIEAGDVTGKVVNIYEGYENALNHGEFGLVEDMKAVDPLTGEATGDAIVQVPKVTGIPIDQNGKLLVALNDDVAEYWGAVVSGRSVGPFQIEMPGIAAT